MNATVASLLTRIQSDLNLLNSKSKLTPLQPWILKQGSRADAMRALIEMGVPVDYQMVRNWGAGQKPNAFARIVLAIKGFSS
jgi:hypothetical protein